MRINWREQLPKIKELGSQGQRMPEIAKHYGVSRQRIKQVLTALIPDWHVHYGGVVLQQKKQALWRTKWGDKEDTDLYHVQREKFSRKKANSTRQGKEWTITFGDLVWPVYCPILGIELDYFAEVRKEESASFDRVDNTKGYIPGNVIVISWRANRIKNDGTSQEHRQIADFMDNHTIVSQEISVL